MASVFDQATENARKAAAGTVQGARSLARDLTGEVTGAASDLIARGKGAALTVEGIVSDPIGAVGSVVGGVAGAAKQAAAFVTGTTVGTLVNGVGSEIIGAASSQGGLIGTVAGIVGGVGANQAADVTWGKLNPKLIANFFACNSAGSLNAGEGFVNAPITDANIEFVMNWQSPFESVGPESKAPALMAMLQTGQFATVINALQTVLPDALAGANGLLNDTANKAREVASAIEGRTGITKLNSRQVFSGMPPIKINLTLHLRALKDPEREIYQHYQRLLRWSLPQILAADGALSNIIQQGGAVGSTAANGGVAQAARSSGDATIKALFPSIAPLMVGMTYGGQVFKPMVLESISNPLDGPRYRDGKYVYLPVQVTLSSLTALDRSDVAKMFLNF